MVRWCPEPRPGGSNSLTIVCDRYERPIAVATPAGENPGEFGLLSDTTQWRTCDIIGPEKCLQQHFFEKRTVRGLGCSNLYSVLRLIGHDPLRPVLGLTNALSPELDKTTRVRLLAA